MKKNIIAVILSVFILSITSANAETIDIIVTGSKTGSTNQTAQLIGKDSDGGSIKNLKLNVISPGGACQGFQLITQQQKGKTFISHYENFYNLVAKMKNDPSCPYISFEKQTPIFSLVQGLYLITKKDGATLEDFSKKSFKVGYASESEIERGWHSQLDSAFGQTHTFVAYDGSSNLRTGLASGEVDAIWTTYGHFVRLKEVQDNYKIVLRTVDEIASVDAPVASKHFKNEKLTRAYLNTWYVFNDKQGIAKKISKSLQNDFKNNKGNFGAYANSKNLVIYFDQKTQIEMEKKVSWEQYK